MSDFITLHSKYKYDVYKKVGYYVSLNFVFFFLFLWKGHFSGIGMLEMGILESGVVFNLYAMTNKTFKTVKYMFVMLHKQMCFYS